MILIPGPHILRIYGFRHLLLISALAACFLGFGCSSGDLRDFSPEIPRDSTGSSLPVTLALKDFKHNQAFILSNISNRKVVALQQSGKLPPFHKVISDEEMGRLIAFMRYKDFFEYARPTGNPPAKLPANVRRTLDLTRGTGLPLRMIDFHGMGTEEVGRRAELLAFIEIVCELKQVHSQTLTLTVDPAGRNAIDFLNQPGLKRNKPGRR